MIFKLIEFLIVVIVGHALIVSVCCGSSEYYSWKQNECVSLEFIEINHYTAAANECPEIVSRKRWGARPAKSVTYQIFPVKYVVIAHTVSPRCSSKLKCSNILLSTQNYYMDELDGDDIPFKWDGSFVGLSCIELTFPILSIFHWFLCCDGGLGIDSFFVGDSPVPIYEGIGWHVRGAHTYNFNSNATGIAFIGDFSG